MSEAGPAPSLGVPSYGVWTVPESPVSVVYSLVVIEEIRHEVLEGFQRLSRGGVEVGGILYGTQEANRISIQAMRPIDCEHARGPAFLLSDNDKAALEEQMRRDTEDQRLGGLTCLGWFLSHTRSDILLSDSDLEIYSHYFGAPWQVTLVVRPGRAGAMRAGFFVREADGAVKTEHSYQEFNFPDRLAGVLDRAPRGDRSERRGGYGRSEGVIAVTPVRRDLPQIPEAEFAQGPQLLAGVSPGRRLKWHWLAVWAVAVIVVAFGATRYFSTKAAPEPIALTVSERDGQLQIEWNHSARPVSGATHGSLAIVDGKQTRTVPLSPKDLAMGKFTYVRESGDIDVRLEVENTAGEKVEEASRFLGRPPEHQDSEERKALEQQRDDLQAEVESLRKENAAQAERIRQLDVTLRILHTRLGAK